MKEMRIFSPSHMMGCKIKRVYTQGGRDHLLAADRGRAEIGLSTRNFAG
jgi:hypothetical protein